MTKISNDKYICIKPAMNIAGIISIQTVGKIYDVEIFNDGFGSIDKSFVGDDGNSYLIFDGDEDFMDISTWREKKLKTILD